jgi:hypothetical protein
MPASRLVRSAALAVAVWLSVCSGSAAGHPSRSAAAADRVPTSPATPWIKRLAGELKRGKSPETVQQELVKVILGHFRRGEIVSAVVGTPKFGARPHPSIGAVGDTWITVIARADDVAGPSGAAASWRASLVAGAFREASHVLRLDDLLGQSLELRLPDGTTRGGFSSIIGKRFGQRVLAEAAARRRIGAALRKHLTGVKAEISFIGGYGPAAVVTIWPSQSTRLDPKATFVAVFGRPDAYEGALLRVMHGQTLVAAVAYAQRTGYSAVSVAEH